MDDPVSDPYSTLGLTSSATAAEIKTAYRQLILRHHPDKVTDPALKDAASTRFHAIQQAHELLSDPARKLEHDEKVKDGAAGPSDRAGPYASAYYHPQSTGRSAANGSPFYAAASPHSPFTSTFGARSPFASFDETFTCSPNYREFHWSSSGRPGQDANGRRKSAFAFHMSFDSTGPRREYSDSHEDLHTRSAGGSTRPRYVFEIETDDEEGDDQASDSESSDGSEYVLENPLDIFDAFHKSQLEMLRDFQSFSLGTSGSGMPFDRPRSRSFRHSTSGSRSYDLFDSLFGALNHDADQQHEPSAAGENPTDRERRRTRGTRSRRERHQSFDGGHDRANRDENENNPSLLNAFLSLPKLAWQNRKSARPSASAGFHRTESMPSFKSHSTKRQQNDTAPDPSPKHDNIDDLADRIMDEQASYTDREPLRSADRTRLRADDQAPYLDPLSTSSTRRRSEDFDRLSRKEKDRDRDRDRDRERDRDRDRYREHDAYKDRDRHRERHRNRDRERDRGRDDDTGRNDHRRSSRKRRHKRRQSRHDSRHVGFADDERIPSTAPPLGDPHSATSHISSNWYPRSATEAFPPPSPSEYFNSGYRVPPPPPGPPPMVQPPPPTMLQQSAPPMMQQPPPPTSGRSRRRRAEIADRAAPGLPYNGATYAETHVQSPVDRGMLRPSAQYAPVSHYAPAWQTARPSAPPPLTPQQQQQHGHNDRPSYTRNAAYAY